MLHQRECPGVIENTNGSGHCASDSKQIGHQGANERLVPMDGWGYKRRMESAGTAFLVSGKPGRKVHFLMIAIALAIDGGYTVR